MKKFGSKKYHSETTNKSTPKDVEDLCKEIRNMDGRSKWGDPEVAVSKKHGECMSGINQWHISEGKYVPTGTTVKKLPPGYYKPTYSSQIGYYFQQIKPETDDVFRLPDTNSEKVVKEIEKFWDREHLYKEFKVLHKLGIFMWGPPGSGKTSTTNLIVQDVIARGGIAITFTCYDYFVENIRNLRKIQPDVPVVVIMEDIEAILKRDAESNILNVLDGAESFEKVVFIATTNFPEELGDRITNRPSRFDKRFKMPLPTKKAREYYFTHMLTDKLIEDNKIDVNNWVADTKGFSIAHCRRLFVAVCVNGDKYEDVIKELEAMSEKISSDMDHEEVKGGLGFGQSAPREY